MNSIFQNYELKSAGTVVCKDLNEAKKWAARFFGCPIEHLYEGRKEQRSEGLVMELFDRKDWAQEDPFYCVIIER